MSSLEISSFCFDQETKSPSSPPSVEASAGGPLEHVRADVGEDDEKPKDIIRFTAETLSVEEVSRLVTSPLCGAVSLFVEYCNVIFRQICALLVYSKITLFLPWLVWLRWLAVVRAPKGRRFSSGTTRNHFEGKKVISLEYEAYIPMAENEVRRICGDVRRKWPVRHIAVFHRLGKYTKNRHHLGRETKNAFGQPATKSLTLVTWPPDLGPQSDFPSPELRSV
ncbi:PREDICTED: molybdopterin synthase catalytic subunit isoform X2 [Myotis brandtii]|uniref:molybdopterin synthase catalytic subunit isoform X2 n=1 Tax=Myotis brandtii TaxID=109478 RepID=UPI000703ED84|nr:PREDICTED: molybdopterin synthase catalytic subunit isoform X2 [Myotis brandtii]